MKAFYTLSFILLVSFVRTENEPLGPSIIKKARKIQTYCQKQTNISDELLLKSRENIFPPERVMQCFLQCNLDVAGLMNSKNEIILEPLLVFLPESWHEMIKTLQETCGTKSGADACEIAYNTFLCYAEHYKEPIIV